jgi:RHS repeat-associated protein
VVQADGSQVPFLAGPNGRYYAPREVQASLVRKTDGSYSYTLPDQTVFAFSATGQLQSEADHNGNQITMGYNGAGLLATITDAANRSITLTYNGTLVQTATDPSGETVQYGYDSNSNLTSVTIAGEPSARWQFSYDNAHEMTSLTDGRGNTTATVYDVQHRATSQTDPMNRTTTWTYGTAPNGDAETTIHNPNGSVTDQQFQNGSPVNITDAYGTSQATTQTLSYNSASAPLTVTDGNNHITSYTYDPAGNRTSVTDANNNTTRWTYDNNHTVLTATTPTGETITYTRDGHGNPLTESRPAPNGTTQTTSYGYNTQGDQTSKTDPLGHVWAYVFDAQGNRTSQTSPLGSKTSWTYDADSRLLTTTTPRGNDAGADPSQFTTTLTRDDRGRASQSQDPLGHITTFAYDGNDNKTDTTDGDGNHTHIAYDADNEPVQASYADGSTTETGYDAAGQVTSQTDGNSHTTTYVRDLNEHVVSVSDPLNRVTTNTYDAVGNLITTSDPLNRTTTRSYDAGNRLVNITYSDGITPNVTYAYDADGNRTAMTDGTGTTSSTFDQLDRLTRTSNGHGGSIGYTYNLANEQTQIAYPNGKMLSQGFDQDGRLTSVTDWLANTTTFAYDANSNLQATTFPSQTANTDQYSYDGADQLTGIAVSGAAGATLSSLTYTRDNNGQVTGESMQGLPGGDQQYVYDRRNRLTQGGAAGYAYDGAGNATTINGRAATYDAANELQTAGTTSYSYDSLGQRVEVRPLPSAVTSNGYDQAGNLISVDRSGDQPLANTYTYDGDGLRASKTSSGATTYFTWDATRGVPLLLDDGQTSYIYGPDQLPIEQITAGNSDTAAFYHHDQIGSTRLLTDAHGGVLGTFSYDAYGNLTGSTGTSTTPFGWAGQYADSDTGLIYLRARYYDPSTGQFLTRDPAAALTQDPYNYAADDPTTNTDPSGLRPIGPPQTIGPGRPLLHVTANSFYDGVPEAGAIWLQGNVIKTDGKTGDLWLEIDVEVNGKVVAHARVHCPGKTSCQIPRDLRGQPNPEYKVPAYFTGQVDIVVTGTLIRHHGRKTSRITNVATQLFEFKNGELVGQPGEVADPPAIPEPPVEIPPP